MALPLNQISGMPNVSGALSGWLSTFTFRVRKDVVTDGLVTHQETDYTMQGMMQPLNNAAIMLKPEGQRSWNWFTFHTVSSSPSLDVNDVIIYNGVAYKIMGQYDWHLNGYMEYHIVAEYQ
jgi:hypothetical protein